MKALKIIVLFALILALLPISTHATSNDNYTYYADGSYAITYSTIIDTRSASTKQTSQTTVHYDPLGNELWRVILNTTFSYDGQTSTCDVANITINVSGSGWYNVSRSASRDGDTGSCAVVMGYKLFGITTDKKTVNMSITCDKNGNIS